MFGGERNFLILCVIFLIAISGCVGEKVSRPEAPPIQPPNQLSRLEAPPATAPVPPQSPPAVEFRLTRKIEVGDGVYSGILAVNDYFYVSFENNGRVYVKEYDRNFTPTGKQHQLTKSGERVADHQMVFGDNHFYLVYSVPEKGDLILKKFDRDWKEIGTVTVVSNAPEPINDMLLSYADGFLYVGTVQPLGQPGQQPLGPPGQPPPPGFGQHIWKYSTDLRLLDELAIMDVPSEIGSSMLFVNGTFVIVSSDRFWDDSSLIVMRYDEDWSFIDSKVISAVSGANERFPMGFVFSNGRYFVSYTHQTGDISSPPPGELPPDYGDVILKAFDQDWNLLGQTKVTDDLPANSANRAHLAMVDDRIYVSYDTRDFKIIVKEYLIRELS
ncbi:hypothetical protein [Candidatus Pyrohabitans sp.]